MTAVLLWSAPRGARGRLRGRARAAVGRARADALAVVVHRAARRPGGARRAALGHAAARRRSSAASRCAGVVVVLAAPGAVGLDGLGRQRLQRALVARARRRRAVRRAAARGLGLGVVPARVPRAPGRLQRARVGGLAHDPDHGRRRAGRRRARALPRAVGVAIARAAARRARARSPARRSPPRSSRSSCTRCSTRRSSRTRWPGRCWRSARRSRRPAARAEPREPRARWRRVAARSRARRASLAWALVPTYPDYDAYHHLRLGPRPAARRHAGLRGPSRPTRTRCTSALGALLSLAGEHADRLLVLVTRPQPRRARRRRVRARPRAVRRGRGARRRAVRRLELRVPALRRARVRRRAVPRARRLGRGAGGARARGAASLPMALLAAAGLLRPEAWVLAGLYWLWCLPGALDARARRAARARRRRAAAVVPRRPRGHRRPAVQPARTPRRWRTRWIASAAWRNVPSAFVTFLADLARPPVALAGVVGLGLALRRFGARPLASRSRCSAPAC